MTGFTGLFSGFKTVFIVPLIVALSLRIILHASTIVGGIATVAALLGLGVFWTAVKTDIEMWRRDTLILRLFRPRSPSASIKPCCRKSES